MQPMHRNERRVAGRRILNARFRLEYNVNTVFALTTKCFGLRSRKCECSMMQKQNVNWLPYSCVEA